MRKLIFCLLLPALIAGCSEDRNPDIDVHTNEAIRFSIGVNSTRAAIDGTYFPEGSEVGIFGLITTTPEMEELDWSAESGSPYALQENLNNGKYTATSVVDNFQELTPERIAKFPIITNSALVFYAYHPYTTLMTQEEEYNSIAPLLPIEIKEKMEDTDDYLYSGPVPAAITREAVKLSFNHALGRLAIKIKKAEEDLPNAVLTKVEVRTKNPQSGNMSLITGEIEPLESEEGITTIKWENANFAINSSEYEDTGAHFLLLPADDALEEVILTIKREDKEIGTEYKIVRNSSDTASERAINLVRGKITTLFIQYNPTDIHFNTEITDWEEYIPEDEKYEFELE